MNDYTLIAFYDELEKIGGIRDITKLFRRKVPISGWSAGAEELAATRGMRGLEAGEELARRAPKRDIGGIIQAKERDIAREMSARAGRSDTEVMKAIQSGALNPKVHSIDEFRRTGNLVTRPGAGKAPSVVAKTEAPTKVLKAPAQPTQTAVSMPPPPASAPSPAPVAGIGRLSRLRNRFEKMSPRSRAALGFGGVGTAGLGGGFGLAEAVE